MSSKLFQPGIYASQFHYSQVGIVHGSPVMLMRQWEKNENDHGQSATMMDDNETEYWHVLTPLGIDIVFELRVDDVTKVEP